jgi:hypothetical protein
MSVRVQKQQFSCPDTIGTRARTKLTVSALLPAPALAASS